MFFDSWDSVARVVVTGACAYAGLILVLRVTGKRTLAKMNAFDFAVTVAFGSTLATVLLSHDVPLADGLIAFALLAALQYAVSTLSVMWHPFKRLVRSDPKLLVENGRYLEEAMRVERLTAGEIDAAIRKHGSGRIEEVAALVLETDGSFSLIRDDGRPGQLSALRSVERPEAASDRTNVEEGAAEERA